MRRESRLLLAKAIDSLILSIEKFNAASDRGRVASVLILLDHSFEMLLKAAILHRGGKIREKGSRETIGFDTCVRRALTDGKIKLLKDEQALTLQSINGLRDAAQHHLIDVSEEQLYLQAQAGVTLFRDVLLKVFERDLSRELPARVLPVSTVAPKDLNALFTSEIEQIRTLLRPQKRRLIEAKTRLRPLAILDATIRGERTQPSENELQNIAERVKAGEDWQHIFVGAASVELVAEGAGPSLSLRISKKEGLPIQVVKEGTPGAHVVGVRRVNELDFYNLGFNDILKKIPISRNKLTAVIENSGLQENPDFHKRIQIGRSEHKRYSQKAIEEIKRQLELKPVDDHWTEWKRNHLSVRKS